MPLTIYLHTMEAMKAEFTAVESQLPGPHKEPLHGAEVGEPRPTTKVWNGDVVAGTT